MGFAGRTAPALRLVARHLADPRPMWLWSADGSELICRNAAARVLGTGPGQTRPALPVGGSIRRLTRLGIRNQTSLSHIPFIAGDKPISMTCACTPIALAKGEAAMLVVGTKAGAEPGPGPVAPEGLGKLLDGRDYVLSDADGTVRDQAGETATRLAGALPGADWVTVDGVETATLDDEGDTLSVTRLPAGPGDAFLHVFETTGAVAPSADAQTAPASTEPEEPTSEDVGEAIAPAVLEPVRPDAPATPKSEADSAAETDGPTEADRRKLTALFDRLAGHAELFTALGPQDDQAPSVPPAPAAPEKPEPVVPEDDSTSAETAGEGANNDEPAAPRLWRITGRRLKAPTPGTPEISDEETPAPTDAVGPTPPQDAAESGPTRPDEGLERNSRYNFDELSRILNDRIANDRAQAEVNADDETVHSLEAERAERRGEAPANGQVLNLGDESLILNRLPIGVAILRGAEVVFVNRAMADITDYETAATLRAAGLDAIFPRGLQPDPDSAPISHLVRADGTQAAVAARLQRVTWQGRAALMLSAWPREDAATGEAAITAFAESLAERREEGFLQISRAGVIEEASARAVELLDHTRDVLVGRPLGSLIVSADIPALKSFLERPARFAETERPILLARSGSPPLEFIIVTLGRAGVVSGYCAFLRRAAERGGNARRSAGEDPAMLGRVSRSMRRPLNTIVGFSELIRAAAFGPIENARYVEYAGDIKSAGQEITALVDELEQYARLADARHHPGPSDVDLADLLEDSIVKLRPQAGDARVLLRSAISERLPLVRADPDTLGQAIRNLLASAIAQTPQGGRVVLSAQPDGPRQGVTVHVRDSGAEQGDLAERFVVFRENGTPDGRRRPLARSGVGLALTRSLLGANGCTLEVEATGGAGNLVSIHIPDTLTIKRSAKN